jgi:tetratricopeptide (TPR) repeat protein
MVLRWLENGIDRPWLMILDNADDTAVFFPQALADMSPTANKTEPVGPMSRYLPRTGGSMLITSRNGDLAKQLTGKADLVLEIDKLEHDDALKLLQNKVSADQSPEADWVALIDGLDRLPLAITQAAAYIAMRRPRMSVSKYLEYFRRDEAKQIALLSMEGGDLRRDPEVPNAVVKTWQISFDQIKRQNALAATILGRMCLFDRQGIPLFLVNQDDDDFEFEEAVGILLGFSFIRSQNDGDSFDMHPLVQLSTKKWLLRHGEMDQRKEEALGLLSQAFPTGEYQNWTVCEVLEPHVQHILRYSYVSPSCKLEYAKILHNNSWFALARGNYNIAEAMAQEAASKREGILGSEDTVTLASKGLLASTFWNQGRWKEAEELNVKVLEMRKRVLGEEHLDTLSSMASMASTFKNQGRWKEAEELNVQVIETRKRVLGEEHLDTLNSMANLASTFRNQGRWKEAEELNIQVLETRKRVLGEEHPDTLTSMARLASTFRNQGRWKEAEELNVQVVETRKRVLGKEHPDTLTSIANLASTFWNQGRWKEAEELDVQVLETSSRALGEEHPDTLSSMASLASTFRNQGRWKETGRLDVQVMETRKRVLGEEHPSTLTSIANLASTYRNQGRWKEAEELDVQVMETSSRALGERHPDTLSSMASLASTFRNQGRRKEAEELDVQVMETRKRVLGEEHPDTLTSMNNLAFTWKSQGRDIEAFGLMSECHRLRKQKLGVDHPYTISSFKTLKEWGTATSEADS